MSWLSLVPRGSEIFLANTKSFDIMFDVNVDMALKAVEDLEIIVDKAGEKVILDRLGDASITIMRREAPWDDRGRNPPHLRETIQKFRVADDTIEVYPTKTVDGHHLGTMLHFGSKNRTIIVPKKGRYLKFYWDKTGRIHFAKSVTRGIIPPNPFVTRTKQIMDKLSVGVALEAIRSVLKRSAV